MPTERLSFTNAAGTTLAARLDRPARPARAAALFAHCFSCGKDILAAKRIAGRLVAEGIAVMRFDLTGIGHSEGELAHDGIAGDVADIHAAAAELTRAVAAPELLIGHSLGGLAALLAAGDMPSLKAVAAIGAPADPAHLLETLGIEPERLRSEGRVAVTVAGREISLGRAFIERAEETDVAARMAALRVPLLLLHAPRDMTVGIENAGRLFTAAKHPKSFVSLDDADHLLTSPRDAEYAAGVIATWASRWITTPPAPDAVPEGITRVSEADAAGFLQDISTGHHTLLADEPKSMGGTDLGPGPYQFLAAGLGACTAMTIRMYARRKGIPLTHVEVDVSHDRVHGEDAGSDSPPRIDRFTRVIRLMGDLDEATRARLLEIADRCPVHRTLENEIRIETHEERAAP